MAYWEHLNIDETTKNALRKRDAETKKKKIFLAISLLIILLITYVLFVINFIRLKFVIHVISSQLGLNITKNKYGSGAHNIGFYERHYRVDN